jgi:regulator of replication initiation timing
MSWYKQIRWKELIMLIMGITIVILTMSTTCINRKNNKLSNNIKALLDTVQTLETKNGDLIYAKQSLIIEKNELEKYLDISKKERKEIEKQLNSSLALITKLQGEINIDTIVMRDSIYINKDTTKAIFNYSDKWVALNGKTIIIKDHANTTLENINLSTPLQVGLTDDYKVFVKSQCPYLSFTDIESASIVNSITNKKTKRWGIGPYIGVGIGGGTDFKGNPQFGWNISVGIAVTYSLLQW